MAQLRQNEPDIAEVSLSRGQLKSGSKDLHGVRFGDLLGEVVVGTDHLGHLWRLRCLGCGATVFLHAATVRQRFAIRGERMACSDCMSQETTTRAHQGARSLFREFWERWGNLYGDGWDERARVEVLEALTTEIAPVRDETEPGIGAPLGYEDSTPKPRSRQMAAYLYPLDIGDDALIRCVDCGQDVERAFGCSLCVEATCVSCVRDERHCCAVERDDLTLEEIGSRLRVLKPREGDMGISRERVRGIQEAGLRKLRKLDWDDEPTLPPPTRPARCKHCRQRLPDGTVCHECARVPFRIRQFRLRANLQLRRAGSIERLL